MQLAPITVDFETYYDDDYSLRKMTTEEYLRDPRFEIIMVSTKVLGEAAEWFTGTLEEIRAYLQSKLLDRRMVIAHNARFDVAILEWHLGIVPKFIADTLSMARGLVGLMTRLSLGALLEFFGCNTRKGDAVVHMKGKRRCELTQWEWGQYGTYCCDDSIGTEEIFLRMMPAMLDSEMKLIDWTIRAFCEPELELDTALIDLELRAFLARQAGLLQQCGVTDITELRSDGRMADLLITAGVEPPTKVSPTTGEITWAFAKSDIEFMDLLEHEDERVVALVEARIGSKTSVVKSRLERFLGISRRGRLPVPLGYAGATPTRRWIGEEKINCQNLPRNKVKRDPVTKAIVYDENKKPVIEPSPLRKAIRCRPGRKMAVADLSQIELRVNAWQSGQQDVLDLLRNGGDSYSDMASVIYGFEITKAMGKSTHTNERFVGKTAVLGCGYGCGGAKFQHMLKVGARREFIVLPDESLDFAQGVVNAYRKKNDRIRNNWYKWNDALEVLAFGGSAEIGPYRIANQKIWLPNGSYLYYPELARREKTGKNEQGVEWSYYRMRHGRRCLTKIYGAKLVENITQAVARLFVSDALLRLQTLKYQDGRPFFSIPNMVHDELVTTFEDGSDENWVREALKWAMTTPPDWAPDIPLAYEGELGYNYAECK